MLCKNCGNKTKESANFCSLTCKEKKYGSTKVTLKVNSLFDKTKGDITDLRQKWQMFHVGWFTLSDVLESRIMQEKFQNNKSEWSYEDFGYFTLVNSDSE